MTNKEMFELCYLYYDEETLEHAKRVANKARDLYNIFNSQFKEYCDSFDLPYINKSNFIYQLALAHDLYEDTEIEQKIWFNDDFEENLQLLTKRKNEDYIDYIKKIRKKAKEDFKYIPAYIVKLADMSDHFSQSATLTERLKNKYVTAMPYLI